MRPGRFVRIVGGETLVSTHGITESRYEALSSKRTSAKAAEDLEKEEREASSTRGSSRSASWASWSSGASNAVSRTWRSLTRRSARCCSILDGGRERMARLMREASAVGARAWLMPDKRRRGKQGCAGFRQRQAAKGAVVRQPAAGEASGS